MLSKDRSKDSSWKEILRTQNDDLRRLEAMDAELNEDASNLDTDITNAMKRSSISSKLNKGTRKFDLRSDMPSTAPIPVVGKKSSASTRAYSLEDDDDKVGFTEDAEDNLEPRYLDDLQMPRTARSIGEDIDNNSPSGLRGTTPKAPDANARLLSNAHITPPKLFLKNLSNYTQISKGQDKSSYEAN